MDSAVEILKRERGEAVERIRALKSRVRDLDRAIDVLESQPAPGGSARLAGDLKSGITKSLAAVHPSGMTPKDIAARLAQAGRETSDASVSSTLSRLKHDGTVANKGGLWFLTDAHASSGSTDSAKNLDGQDSVSDDSDVDSPW